MTVVPAEVARRSRGVDVLRVTAMALVVLLHVAAPAVATITLPGARWHLANVLDSLARPAVPLFLMLSGALAMRAATATAPVRFLCRRGAPFWIPALTWAIAFTAWDAWRDHKPWHAGKAALAVLRGDAHYHLWYVWIAGGLLFALPVLARWWTSAAESERRYALVVWGALSVLAPWAGRLWLGGAPRLTPLVIGGYAGLPVLGAWLAAREWRGRQRPIVQLAGVAALAMTIGGTALLRHQSLERHAQRVRGDSLRAVGTTRTLPEVSADSVGRLTSSPPASTRLTADSVAPSRKAAAPPRFDDRYYGYLTPNVVAMAIAWWVTIIPLGITPMARTSQRGGRDGPLTAWIADASYPVYLVHPMVLEGGARLSPAMASTLADPRLAPLVALAAIGASLVVVAVGSRIPLLRAVIPVAARRGPAAVPR